MYRARTNIIFMNQKLVQYLQQQIRTTNERLKNFTHGINGKEHPKRFMFIKVEKYINDFLLKKSATRVVIMPGFRGVGKTTLMSQICSKFKNQVPNVLFISVEEAKNLFDVGVADLMSAYEEILGENLESVKKPILVFLDEIQSDPKWDVSLKSLFERTTNVFFCCTGSSAVALQTSANLARRAVLEKMPPMCFTEYQMTQNNIYPIPKLKDSIRSAVYLSKDCNEVYSKLLALRPTVNQYWSKASRMDIKKYLSYGTLPFAFTMPDEIAVYDSISALLDKMIFQDLPTLGKFSNEVLGATKRILFAIAENDTTSLTALEQRFNINRETIANVFEALEKAELLIKVPAYGSNMTIAKKASKYLFMSPAIRMTFFHFTGQESTYLMRQGKLLEDSVGSHLYRELVIKRDGAIRYDSSEGGADFILQIQNSKQIIIEVGTGDKADKGKKQIANSSQKINSDYNLIFSSSELKIEPDLKLVFVPLDYYFLM